MDWRPTVGRQSTGNGGERSFTTKEAWLTQAQVCKVIAKSETKEADAALDWIIAVFVAAQRGDGAKAVAMATGAPQAPRTPAQLPPDVHIDQMDITPEIAKAWLEKRNNVNRHISPATVARYAADLKAGEWWQIVEPISLGPDGEIINGQHRLTAIVETGIAARIYIVTYGSAGTGIV